MVKSEEVAYYAKHEEVDTRMIHHVGQLPSGTNVIVRTVDTDVVVVVIALGCFHQLQDKRVWVFSPKTTLHTSALTNYLTNLESHSAKHCHSTMPLLGVITHLCSTEKGR